jgi:hypothetical protein
MVLQKLTCLPADPSTSVTHDDDTELQKALEASRVAAGLPPQESGITSTDKVHFGPATRTQYDEEKWSMVPVGKSSAQEILLDPEPAARKRDFNVPAFLRPSTDNNRLNALFTIYHEIPLLREVLLNRADVQQSYGFDSEWWTGKAIEVPYVSGCEPDEGQELIYEMQRLMAFLDKTDRSYGSADALANARAVKKMQRFASQRSALSTDLESVVWYAWRKVFDPRETGQIPKVFSLGVDSEQQNETQEFAILDLPLPGKTSDLETFYDIADEALWSSQEQTEAALEMRLQKTAINEEVSRISRLKDSLTEVCVRGKIVKVQNLLKAALRHDLDEVEAEGEADPNESFLSEDAAISRASSEKAAKLSAELGKIVASIDKKLLGMSR